MPYFGKYKSPSQLVNDESLSKDEKIRMLEQWCEDERALKRAAEEGMHGGVGPELKEVQKALDELRNSPA